MIGQSNATSKQRKHRAKYTISTPEDLAKVLDVDLDEVRQVHDEFPLRVNRYYLSLIQEKGDPIWRQAIPDAEELYSTGVEDPLGEEHDSPVSSITHRYPDRVLFYVSHVCAVYCRFCTRKRKVSDPQSISQDAIEQGLEYIREHSEIRDVIVSGGDPLMLTNEKLEAVLKPLKAIEHVEIIRIGTRVPVTFPRRITQDLCNMLKKYHPLFINTHFNHPREITPESTRACNMLADAGIPLGNQSVLLKGVNDDPDIMKELVQKLLSIRVKPYYIYQADLVAGTDHFRTSVEKGWEIMDALRGHTSGMAVPFFVIDGPDGAGKIAINPDPVISYDEEEILLRNYEGLICSYPTTNKSSKCQQQAMQEAQQ